MRSPPCIYLNVGGLFLQSPVSRVHIFHEISYNLGRLAREASCLYEQKLFKKSGIGCRSYPKGRYTWCANDPHDRAGRILYRKLSGNFRIYRYHDSSTDKNRANPTVR